MTIYEAMVEIGAEIDSHYSDLYVKDSPEVRKALKAHGDKYHISAFRSEVDGCLWYDIAFCYDPFWLATIEKAKAAQ